MKNPIPIKYRKGRNGCPKQPRDNRDIVLGDIPFISDPSAPSWVTGFDNEVKYGKLKREHQGNSKSCVGQGWSKYVEMLNLIEEKQIKDLSARDVYSQIFLPEGGAYIRDGALVVVNKGICEESYLVSYDEEKPPTEAFMRRRNDLVSGYENNRIIYKAKKFVYLDTNEPLTEADWENIRQIIWQFGGFVSGYYGHCMYVSAYGMVDGKKSIKFINSYGEGSDKWWNNELGNTYYLYDVTFLVDLPNVLPNNDMLKIIGDKKTNRQYLVGKDGLYTWIYNVSLLEWIHNSGVADKNIVEWQDNFDNSKVRETLALIK